MMNDSLKCILSILSMIIIVQVTSCTSNDFKNFEEIDGISLSGKTTSLLEGRITLPKNLMIRDSILIIHRASPFPYYFEAYNINSESFITEFGLQGNGPNELPDYGLSSLYEDKLGLVIPNDGNSYIEVSIDEILNSKELILKPDFKFENVHGGDFTKLNDSIFATLSLSSENRILLANDKGQNIGGYFSYPIVESLKELPNDLLGMAHQAYLTRSISRNRVAVFTMNSACWDIYDFSIPMKPIKVNQSHWNEVVAFDASRQISQNSYSKSVAFGTNNTNGFLDIDSNDEFIYALYSGKNYNEHGMGISESNIILAIDWEGNIVNKYLLDQEVNRLAISDDGELYCSIEKENSTMIIKYKL